jgi:outer membrane lipoprotein-sorting protein
MIVRRALLAGLASACAIPRRLTAGAVPLEVIASYVAAITTLRAPFVQVNGDGSIATGTLLIQRPARARLDYDDAGSPLIIASGGQVAIFDGASKEPPTVYPTSRTPLALLLDRRADLATSPLVVGVREEGGATLVVLRDPETPEMGTVELAFAEGPVRLLGWSVTGEAGERVDVMLDPPETGIEIPPSTFSIDAEMRARGLVKID